MRMNKAAYDGPDVATRTGPFVKYIGRGGTYVLAKKGGQGSGKHSQAVRDNRALFAEVTALMHMVDGDTYQWCRDQAKGTLYLPRDILAKLIYGTLMRFEMTDGTYRIGVRMVANDIQKMLDGISQSIGAMLVRTQEGWAAIEPGSPNQVMAMDENSGLPIWRNEAISAPQAQATLDQVSAASGAVLYRTDDAWHAVSPGNAGQFLRIDPVTGFPAWAFVVLNANEFSTSLDGISSVPGSTILRTAEKWTTQAPGTAGQFYVIDRQTGLPVWKTVDLGELQVNAALNTLSTDVGALALRGEDVWLGVPPGNDGYVLTSRGAGQVPYWAAPTGGAGGSAAERLTAPVENVGGSTQEAMWTRNFAAGEVANGKSIYRIKATFNVIASASSLGVSMHFDGIQIGSLVGNNATPPWVYVLEGTITQYKDKAFFDVEFKAMTDYNSLATTFRYTSMQTVLPENTHVLTVDAKSNNDLSADVICLQTLIFEALE